MSKYSIFISYRRTGFETANLIAEKLKSMGYSVFFDVESLRGGKFNEQLFNVIDQCTDFVLILPENALDRCADKEDWVRKEVTYAMLKGKNIVPVMLRGFEWPNLMPSGMESLKEYTEIRIPKYEYFDYAMECIIRHLHNENNLNYTMDEFLNQGAKYDLFISYNRKDVELAAKIKIALGSHLNVYMADDSSCMAGNFEMMINDAIKHSRNYLILLTADCLTNYTSWGRELQYILKEIDSAPSKSILPLNIDNQFCFASRDENSYQEIVRIMDYNWLILESNRYETTCSRIVDIIDGKFESIKRIQEKTHYDVFLAYARLDNEAGDKVYNCLVKNGFSVWRDVDCIDAGANFARVIKDAIDNVKVFLLIESIWSKDSSWVKQELEYARRKNIHIINVLTDNPKGLAGVRRMNFSPNILVVGTKMFEEKLLAIVMSKGCISNTSVIYREGERLYNEMNSGNFDASQTKKIGKESFSLFLRAIELGDVNAQMYIDSKPWSINLIECVNQYKEIYSNFISDLREGIYNKGVIIAEDETLSDSPQRGRGMECVAFKFMKRAINLGFEGAIPEDYDWYFLEENDFKICNDTLGFSSTYPKKTEKEIKFGSHKPNTTLYVTDLNSSSNDANSYTAFLSHSSDDKETIQKVYDMLKMSSYRPWMAPQDIVPGKPYAKSIIEGIKECPIFLIFVSSSAMNSDNVLSEVEKAHKERKVVLPIFIEDVKLNDELEYYLARKQWIKAFGQIEDFYNLIIDSIKENLK